MTGFNHTAQDICRMNVRWTDGASQKDTVIIHLDGTPACQINVAFLMK